MAKKKAETPKDSEEIKTEEPQSPREMLQLFVGVNFTPEGKTEEERIEPGLIELNLLPSAFQTRLISRGKARIRLN